jgi:hypothetical protein
MTTKMFPSQQRKRPLFGLFMPLLVMAAGMAGGCEESYRINHFHNDANQKAAEQSLQVFEDFTSQTAGLEPTLLKNIDARKQLEDAVGASRSRVRDTQAAGLTTDATWERLRLETYVNLGLLQRDDVNPPRPLKLNEPDDYKFARARARNDGYEALLNERIATRELKVTAIAKVLKLTADAHQVLAEETNKKYKQTEAELAQLQNKPDAAGAASTDPTGNARVQWVHDLFQKIVDSRTAFLNNQEVMKTANDVQRKVLAEIEASRDPVEAAALVPIVGTGLSDFDFAILDAYVIKLDKELETLDLSIQKIDKSTPAATQAADTTKSAARSAWDDLKQSLDEARVWVEVAVWLSHAEKDPDNWFSAAGTRKLWNVKDENGDHNNAIRNTLRPAFTNKNGATAQAEQRLATLLDRCEPQSQADRGAQNLAERTTQPPQKARIKNSTEGFSTARSARINHQIDALKLHNDDPMKDLLIRALGIGRARDGSALQETINAIRLARQDVKGAASKARASAGAAATLASDTPGVAAVSSNARSAKSLAAVSSSRAKLAITLRQKIDAANTVSNSPAQPQMTKAQASQDLESYAKELAGISDSGLKDLNAEQGFQLLNKFLGLDSQIAGLIDDAVKNKSISEDELKWLGGVVSDIEQGEVAKHERILIFLNDLYGAALDLGQENSRHAQGMLTIANVELRRWALLGDLNEDYSTVFDPPVEDTTRLFALDAEIQKWNDAIKSPALPAPGDKIDLRRHPAIHGVNQNSATDFSYGVLTSIRQLRETAKAWQDAPQISDPDGINLRIANDRLFKAVRTVDGNLLMISLNQHISEENVVRLRAELASHDIRLDTLKTRVEEAGYRLTLGDLKAFHTSGITDQDIQTIADVFANGFLAWIGRRVTQVFGTHAARWLQNWVHRPL